MHRRIAFCLATWLGVLASSATIAAAPADRVFVNARVWTGEPEHALAEAFAVRGDRFVAVGTNDEVGSFVGPGTVITDLAGRRVVPGFNDAHWHLPARRSARLDDAEDVAGILLRLAEYARSLSEDTWVVGAAGCPTTSRASLRIDATSTRRSPRVPW